MPFYFADLGKAAKDILTGSYNYDTKFAFEAKHPDGVVRRSPLFFCFFPRLKMSLVGDSAGMPRAPALQCRIAGRGRMRSPLVLRRGSCCPPGGGSTLAR